MYLPSIEKDGSVISALSTPIPSLSPAKNTSGDVPAFVETFRAALPALSL